MIVNYHIQGMAAGYHIYRRPPNPHEYIRLRLDERMKRCSGSKRLRKKKAQQILYREWWSVCWSML